MMQPYKIMVIEDDPIIQEELQTLLNGNGYEAVAVRNFSTTIEEVKSAKPHLILLDIKLPAVVRICQSPLHRHHFAVAFIVGITRCPEIGRAHV